MVRTRSLTAGLLLLLPLLAFAAQPRVKVGDTAEARIQSPHPITSGLWRQEMEFPGATFVKLHLAELRLGPSDLLLLFDGAGNEVYRHEGPLAGGGWLPSVEGAKLTLEIWADRGSAPWGLLVDQVGYGTPAPEAAPAPESICGSTDWQDAACYQSDAGKWAAGDPVGRLFFQDGGGWYLCTGELVSATSQLLTNNHCISTEASAQSLEVKWRYQYPGCGSGTVGYDSRSNGAHLILTDPDLDFSLLQIAPDTPADRYGYLTLNPNVPSVGDVLWIAEHPGGQPKKFAVNSDMDGGLAKVQALGLIGGNGEPGVAGGPSDIGYYADTAGGSSGSPVFDANNAVIALHHFGLAGTTCNPSDMNQGVEMALVYPLIAPYLGQVYFTATAAANPTSGFAPLTVHFTGSAAGGTAPYAYDWDFGDGSAHASAQNPAHTYVTPGTYTVTFTATDSASHTATDSHLSIQAQAPVTPPAVSSVVKGINPFRLKIYGTNFHPDCTVKIGGVAVPETAWKSGGLVVAKKGAALKAMVPKGQEVQITVTNNDDGGVSAAFAYTR